MQHKYFMVSIRFSTDSEFLVYSYMYFRENFYEEN